ncbi:MAG: hypothetical protein IJ209_10185 [Bacteroidaceae bacterium]|nr:hypothetical protein [Bacteroidaceae bacterium]
MKYLSKLLFIAVAALGFAACADDSYIVSPGGQQPGDMPVNITFSFADKARPTRSMVSGEETKVTTMQLVCFDANGLYLGIRNAEVTNDNPTATDFYDSGVIKGSVPQGTARIHFIANRNLDIPLSHNVGTGEETVMRSAELSTAYDDTNHQLICYWGYHKEASADAMNTWLNPTSNPSVVYMIRDRAKVILRYDNTDAPFPVQKIEWLIHNGRKRGYLAPKSSEWENYYGNSTAEGHESELVSTATLNEYTAEGRYTLYDEEQGINEDGNFDVAYNGTTNTLTPQFLFEDGNTALEGTYPKIILKVTYMVNSTTKTVYHVLKLNDNDKVQYDIVRNNTYYVTCKHLSPDIAYFETLKDAINGNEFMNADIEIDRSITDVNDENYTLQILLPTETTSVVLNTEGEHDEMEFAFRMASDVNQPGSTNINDFEVSWEQEQSFCSDLTLTYNESTKQFQIHTTVLEGKLTDQLQSEWIVVKHKDSGLTRYIHVFVIDQFRYKIYPKLTRVGTGTYGDCLLSFQIPPMEHSHFLEDGTPDPTELVYPQELYPIEIKFATNTLNAYGTTQGQNNYGLFGVSVESTIGLLSVDDFEEDYDDPLSTTNTSYRTYWYYQQLDNYWDFWYSYQLKTYPTNGEVSIYFKDVRQQIQYANISDVGLFLYVEYFGKNYSVPRSTN